MEPLAFAAATGRSRVGEVRLPQTVSAELFAAATGRSRVGEVRPLLIASAGAFAAPTGRSRVGEVRPAAPAVVVAFAFASGCAGLGDVERLAFATPGRSLEGETRLAALVATGAAAPRGRTDPGETARGAALALARTALAAALEETGVGDRGRTEDTDAAALGCAEALLGLASRSSRFDVPTCGF